MFLGTLLRRIIFITNDFTYVPDKCNGGCIIIILNYNSQVSSYEYNQVLFTTCISCDNVKLQKM